MYWMWTSRLIYDRIDCRWRCVDLWEKRGGLARFGERQEIRNQVERVEHK